MATCYAPLSLSGGRPQLKLKAKELKTPKVRIQFGTVKPNYLTQIQTRNLSIRAEYRSDGNSGGGGGGGDFFAGFLVGGAVFGTLAYIFAPQIRRSLLNEDEYGFRRARKPIYYDEGLEKTRHTLNEKISQLNSAIDNVSSRLRGGNNAPKVPVETDPEVEATM